MDPTLLFILSVVELLGKYGLPAVIKIIQTWQVDKEPTLDDIIALRAMVPPFDSYFPPK